MVDLEELATVYINNMNFFYFFYNIHFTDKQCKLTDDFLNIMLSNSFHPAITKPTRISEHTATVIDNIYCNTMPNSLTGIFYKDVSDHLPIFIANRTKLKKLKTSNDLPSRNLCAENISKLRQVV